MSSEISEDQICRTLKNIVGILVNIHQRSRTNRLCVCVCVCVCARVCKKERFMEFMLWHYGIGFASSVS